MKELILAYQGEMTLKGLNRGKFEARLAKTIRWRLEPLGKFKVYQAQSTVFIEPKEDGLDMDEAFRRVSHVFGIVKLSRAVECPKDFAAICETAEAYLGETLRGIRTFKVEAKRADKTYPMKSPEICRELGAYLLDKHHHLRVDVHNPQLEIMVEIRDYAAYVHGPKVEAAGGLPVGTSGRALNLLSGGIDSPVAAWCMARRGLALHHIHFASPPYTSLRAKLKVRDLARELVEYTGNCTLFVVPYTKPQEYIRDNAPDVLFTVLMRRSMLRIANQVAKKLELQALITGESLAQVASQTMAALACTDQAQDLPVLRPCIGMDKIEIINISRKIGTFETSIEPYEDCCTIFTPPHPKTNPTLDEILAAEAACNARIAEFKEILGAAAYDVDVPALEYTVVRALREHGLHAAAAESCTGGMIAERLTNVPGSSEVFGYGFVTYAEAAKQKLLGVDAAVIEKYNVVSGPVAAAMAFGAARESGAELAVGITGLAGPGGALPGKPVGTVYLAGADTRTDTGYLMRLTLGGYQDRQIIRTRAALYALDMLRRMALGLDVPDSVRFTPETADRDLDI